MNQKIYENYAKLAVKIGINLQKGQDVIITASTNLAEIVKEFVKTCYENGARTVTVDWTNEEISKLHDKKNNDYGGAYYEMLNECGTAAGSGIIYNKSRRLANLIKDKTEQMVNDESIEVENLNVEKIFP